MLKIQWSESEQVWHVYNTFDGVILGSFTCEEDAALFAHCEETLEVRRIYNEFG